MMTIVGWKWTSWQVVKILQTTAWCGIDMLCGAWLTVSDTIPTQPCMTDSITDKTGWNLKKEKVGSFGGGRAVSTEVCREGAIETR